jgi:hypothetical protein
MAEDVAWGWIRVSRVNRATALTGPVAILYVHFLFHSALRLRRPSGREGKKDFN